MREGKAPERSQAGGPVSTISADQLARLIFLRSGHGI